MRTIKFIFTLALIVAIFCMTICSFADETSFTLCNYSDYTIAEVYLCPDHSDCFGTSRNPGRYIRSKDTHNITVTREEICLSCKWSLCMFLCDSEDAIIFSGLDLSTLTSKGISVYSASDEQLLIMIGTQANAILPESVSTDFVKLTNATGETIREIYIFNGGKPGRNRISKNPLVNGGTVTCMIDTSGEENENGWKLCIIFKNGPETWPDKEDENIIGKHFEIFKPDDGEYALKLIK